jgi:hypothetical protein
MFEYMILNQNQLLLQANSLIYNDEIGYQFGNIPVSRLIIKTSEGVYPLGFCPW